MRRVVLSGACAALLSGPTVLAFFTGGYFNEPRDWAGLVVFVLVAVSLIAAPRPLPITTGGRLAIVGLALFAVWTLVSFTWAPIAGAAYQAGQRVVLYAGVLFAAAVLLRDRVASRAVEPALAAGTLIVIGYGLSERLLPGLLHFSRSLSAQGRLEQPLTYWNAMGEVAAIGLVLCARMAGDRDRPRALRIASAAAAAPLGMGLYLSFSRGALFAWVAGLIALIVLAPTRAQLRATVVSVLAAALGAVSAAPFHSVATLAGAPGTRERQGAIALALLAVAVVLACIAEWLSIRAEHEGELRLPRGAAWIALGVICAGLALAIVVGAKEKSTGAQLRPGSQATRLTTFQSSRYAYWKVALRAFGDQPLRGVGAEGWSVYWLRYRPISDFAQDAHSLELQTLADLGVVGGVLLLGFLGGTALAARDAQRASPALAAGPIAGFVVYVAHSPLDWDWQMPALTVIALVLAGAVIALAEIRVLRPR
jgi:O-antigen ligase